MFTKSQYMRVVNQRDAAIAELDMIIQLANLSRCDNAAYAEVSFNVINKANRTLRRIRQSLVKRPT